MQLEKLMNPEQLRAVKQIDGPLLILAGAGSGKTRVVTHRIAYMIEQGINPWNILAIAFTNKAAGEMRERVDDIVGFGSDSVWISTFHSTCVRILRRHIDRLGYETNFTIYDTDDQKATIKQLCKSMNVDTKYLKEKSILGAISAAKNEMQDPDAYENASDPGPRTRKIAEIYREYQKTLKKNNALDFDDLLVKTVQLFQRCPDILENYQERFRYICVDEYQDTNTVQFELIRLLAMKYRNLCVVGDDDQSIYKFRGANIRNILDFEKNYPDAMVVKLEQNYRSTKNILDAANAVIANNRGRKSKALWTEKQGGRKVHFRQFANANEEAEFVAYDIARKVRERETTYKDCAVLYRTNAQSRVIEEQFVRDNIAYRLVGGTNFYSRKEIKDVLAYLKTIDSGNDDLMLRRIINVPKRGIGTVSLDKAGVYADEAGISLFEAFVHAGEIPGLGKTADKMKAFTDMIRILRTKQREGYYDDLPELIDDVLQTTGYLAEYDKDEPEDRERLENIDELITKAAAYEEKYFAENPEAEKGPSLQDFLTEVSLVADIDSVDSSAQRVLLMTIHSSKGLEFSHVYLTGMEDGVFPGHSTLSSDDATELEEERRLAYVGITRAKEDLTLTCAKARMLCGETQYNPVSTFVREIPETMLEGNLPKRISYDNSFDSFGVRDVMRTSPYGMTKPKAVVAKPASKPYASKVDFSSLKKGGEIGKQELDYKVGDRVSHVKFGEGVVLSIESTSAIQEVTVDFEKVGRRVLVAAYAKLVRIDSN